MKIHKILEAIDKAVMNVLSTDITDQDIDFNNVGIDNSFSAIMSLADLSKYDIKDFSKFDTKDSVTLIDDQNNELSLHEYDGRHIEYVNLKACDENGFKDVIINTALKIDKKRWAITYIGWKRFKTDDAIPDDEIAAKDFNGYEHTYHNANIIGKTKLTKLDNYPAIEYCIRQSDGRYDGYLGSAGQMVFIGEYIDVINKILTYANGRPLSDTVDKRFWYFDQSFPYDTESFWVSTEQSYIDGYQYSFKSKKIFGRHTKSYFSSFVLPLFKKRRL